MNIMESRYRSLQQALAGYEQTGVPLVAFDGARLVPAGFTDDSGIYYFLPGLVRLLDVPLGQAIDIFFRGIVGASLALGILGAIVALRGWAARLTAIVGLVLLSRIVIGVGDVYVVPASVAVAIVPLSLYFIRRRRHGFRYLVFGAFAGICIGLAHVIRNHAGTAVFIFVGTVVLLKSQLPRHGRIAFLVVLVLGVTLPLVHFNRVVGARDAYLLARTTGYQPGAHIHPFWHSVYIGFGFLDNELGIAYLDEVASAKVSELSPKAAYLSREYEETLRVEVVRLVRDHPLFVARTIAAKIWALGRYVLIFANVGLLAAVVYRKPWHIDLAFFAALAFSALFGILVIPALPYVLGLVAFSTLYGIVSIGEAAERNAWGRVKRLLPIGRR